MFCRRPRRNSFLNLQQWPSLACCSLDNLLCKMSRTRSFLWFSMDICMSWSRVSWFLPCLPSPSQASWMSTASTRVTDHRSKRTMYARWAPWRGRLSSRCSRSFQPTVLSLNGICTSCWTVRQAPVFQKVAVKEVFTLKLLIPKRIPKRWSTWSLYSLWGMHGSSGPFGIRSQWCAAVSAKLAVWASHWGSCEWCQTCQTTNSKHCIEQVPFSSFDRSVNNQFYGIRWRSFIVIIIWFKPSMLVPTTTIGNITRACGPWFPGLNYVYIFSAWPNPFVRFARLDNMNISNLSYVTNWEVGHRLLKHPIFAGMPAQFLTRLSLLFERKVIHPQTVIFAEDEVGSTMVVFNVGKADIIFRGLPISMLWSGKSFGGAQMMGVQRQYHATVRTKTMCHVLLLSNEQFCTLTPPGPKRPWVAILRHRTKTAFSQEVKLFKQKHLQNRILNQSGVSTTEVTSAIYSRVVLLHHILREWNKLIGDFDAESRRNSELSVMDQRNETTETAPNQEPSPSNSPSPRVLMKQPVRPLCPLFFSRALRRTRLIVPPRASRSRSSSKKRPQSGRASYIARFDSLWSGLKRIWHRIYNTKTRENTSQLGKTSSFVHRIPRSKDIKRQNFGSRNRELPPMLSSLSWLCTPVKRSMTVSPPCLKAVPKYMINQQGTKRQQGYVFCLTQRTLLGPLLGLFLRCTHIFKLLTLLRLTG